MASAENETTVAYTDADTTVLIYTCIRKDITAMKKKKQFKLRSEGFTQDGVAYANFAIARDDFDISQAARVKRNMTSEQRAESANRLRKAREAKRTNKETE